MASSYEAERLANIARNDAVLSALGLRSPSSSSSSLPSASSSASLPSAAAAAAALPPALAAAIAALPLEPLELLPTTTGTGTGRGGRTKAKRPPDAPPPPPAKKRTSARLRGQTPAAPDEAADDGVDAPVDGGSDDDDPEAGTLVDAEDFFDPEVVAKAIRVDGHFHGWVNPAVQQAHGLEPSAEAAWSSNGGGAFSFKNPTGAAGGKGKRVPKAQLPAGWSEARYFALKMFRKNPNMYFYRLTEPGVEHWQGDWTDEEKALFLEVVRKYGCGDKWGLFSTYIPHRVGYQCSAFYRAVILEEGLVIDPNYKLTAGSGHAIYVGPHSRLRRE